MRLQLGHREIADLLAAHALDAVDADEAEAIEAHLSDCDRCSADMTGFRAVVALFPAPSPGHPEGSGKGKPRSPSNERRPQRNGTG